MATVFLAGLAAAAYVLLNETVTPMPTLQLLQAGAGVLGVASKLPQIITIAREGGTGQLSAFAVFNYLAGSLSRIFTTLQEVDDNLILYGFVSGFLLNAVLAAQMVYYWNAPASKSTTQTKLTGKGQKAAQQAVIGATKDSKTRRKLDRCGLLSLRKEIPLPSVRPSHSTWRLGDDRSLN
nr:mannose-p-dolichol utilization defect 1 protein like [Quercus suber]